MRNITKEDIFNMLPSYKLLIENNADFKDLINKVSLYEDDNKELNVIFNELNSNYIMQQAIKMKLQGEVVKVTELLLHPLSDYDNCDDAFKMYFNDMQLLNDYWIKGTIDSKIFELMAGVLYTSYKRRNNKEIKNNVRSLHK